MATIDFIKEPLFWLISAFGSIFLSILANLITPYLNSILSNFSDSRKKKVEQKRVKLINEIANVSLNQNNILNYKIDAAYWILRGIFLIVMGILIFSLSKTFISILAYPALIIASVFIARSSQWINEAKDKYQIAQIASDRAKAMQKFKNEYYHENYTAEGEPEDPFYQDLNKMIKEWDQKHIK